MCRSLTDAERRIALPAGPIHRVYGSGRILDLLKTRPHPWRSALDYRRWLMTRVDDYGLRRYIGGSSGLSSGECLERFELTQKALSDWRGGRGLLEAASGTSTLGSWRGKGSSTTAGAMCRRTSDGALVVLRINRLRSRGPAHGHYTAGIGGLLRWNPRDWRAGRAAR